VNDTFLITFRKLVRLVIFKYRTHYYSAGISRWPD